MKRMHFALAGMALAVLSSFSSGQETIADIFKEPGLNLDRPADRAQATQRIRAAENARRQEALAMARQKGWATRGVTPDNRTYELLQLDDDGNPVYAITHNREAAISTAANLVRDFAPYNLSGEGMIVGVWDGGWVRIDHQEFTSPNRVVHLGASASNDNHATHVAGTIGARGIDNRAMGMAPDVMIHSYNWTNPISEMNATAATGVGQTDKLYISNHSWGYISGWANGNWSGTQGRHWWGGTNREDPAYGRYDTSARDWDTVAFNAPYFLIVHSAGNDRNNNAPSTGTTYYYRSGSSWVSKAYDPATDPYNIGWKDGGFNTINNFGNSKNLLVVGAVNDAVSGSERNIANATMSAFSGWGPTDDGRIKPDVVGNGVGVYSPNNGGPTSYQNMSGTSMSSPNVAGSAALLVEQYRKLFPGDDMLASTLKGLIIHTADDLGRPGPDYTFGWGLMNTKEAVDLIIDHHANPEKNRMSEGLLNGSNPSDTFTFTWDGVSPIRATLCWTDPAGTAISALNSTSSRLVNDLDMRLIAPDGTYHYPYVMPFVGTWTIASMSENATTGDNHTDNVEQIFIENPEQSGTWELVITHKGTLTNNQQRYSLITTGLSAAPLSIEVARAGNPIGIGGVDGVSGAAVGSGTQLAYVISNVGGGQLELTTPVTISGQQNCSVTVDTQPISPVDGGSSTNLIATVTPAASGTWSFNVSIANNDPDKDPYHWTVTGLAGSSATVSFTPVADTYINAASTGSNYGSETIFSIWNRAAGNPGNYRYGLLRFDLSSIPGGTTITSASLDFAQNNNASGSVDIYEATGAWTEGGATWNNSNTLIGDTLYGTANAPGTAGATVPSINLNASGLAKVQSWINAPSGNHGFGLKTENSGPSNNIDLRSREHATEAHRPRLTLTYGGGSAEAPLMTVSGSGGYLPPGTTDAITDSVEGVASQLTYTINNFGNANLTMTTPVTVTPVSNCSVSVTTQPSSPVAASGSTNLVLNVTPAAAGSWSATVSIANNDPDKNPYTWTISGSAFGSHALTYNGNGNDSGEAPVDPNSPYLEASTVTALGNTGSLTKDGFAFAGWNTAANGSGTTYQPGDTFPMPGAAVTLYAVWNAAPTVDAGADQTLYLTGGDWTPLQVEPGLWLDAADTSTITLNGSNVSQWADKSGNDRHATQGTAANQPANTPTGLNGKRVITFDGSNDFFTVDLDFLAGESHSAFIVTKPTSFSNIYGAATSAQGANSLHVGFNSNNYRMNFWGNDFGPARSANFVADEANIVNYVWNSGVGKEIFANGKSEGSNANAGVIGTMAGGGRIGHTTTAGHPAFGGDIAEIIIIPRVLSLEERQEVEGYLAHKWGLAANLANDHPYKNEEPVGTSAVAMLQGTADDPEDDELTTQWTLESGPFAIEIDSAADLATSAIFTREGVYTLRLTADDGFSSVHDDVVITVHPPIEERTVTYNGNGNTSGEAPVDPDSPYEDDSTVTVLGAGNLARTGHTFAGWNTAANGSGIAYAPDDTFTINANTTLHAQWTPNTYTVTFDANGGTAPDPADKQVTFDAAYGTLATTTRVGYSLIGWFTAPSGGTQVTEATVVSTAENHTLHAQWEAATYTVSYDGNGNTGGTAPSDQTKTHDIDLTLSGPGTLVRAGYSFAGWNTAGNGTGTAYAAEATYSENEAVTLYAQWTANTYTITFDPNGGTAPDPTDKQVTFDAPYGTLATTSRPNHSFAGWFTAAEGGTEVTAAIVVATAGNHTLFAQWSPDTYTVTYNGNENTSGTPPPDQTKIYNVALTLAANTGNLVKTGFTFAGWNTAADGSGTAYSAGATYTENAPVTLYAQWSAGADGTWLPTTAGPFNWSDSANWVDGLVASGTDRTAAFTPNITADQTVNLDAPRIIGNITFTDSTTSSHNLTISGEQALTLSRSSGFPLIDVTQSNRTLTVAGDISGGDGLQKDGPGILRLTGANSFTGGIVIEGGRVIPNSDSALGATSNDITFTGTQTALLLPTGTFTLGADRTIISEEGAMAVIARENINNQGTINYDGRLTGAGGVQLSNGYQLGSVTFNLSDTGHDFQGILRIGGDFSGANQFTPSNVTVNIAGLADGPGHGNIQFGRNHNNTGNNLRFIYRSDATSDLVLNHRRIELDSTVGISNIINNNTTYGIIINTDLLVSRAGAKRLNLNAASGSDNNTFAGNIVDGENAPITLEKSGGGTWSITGGLSQTGGLVAAGAGTLNLSGTNTYSGPTTLGFANPGAGLLVFQGMHALSEDTSIVQTHAGGSGQHNTLRLLDDSATPDPRPDVDLTFNHANNSKNSLSVFVGNNGPDNGGNGVGGATGGTIRLGNMNFNQTNAGQTAGTMLTVAGADDYELGLGDVNVSLMAAFAGTWPVELRANAPLVINGGVRQSAGSDGSTNLQLAGSADGSEILGAIMDSADGTPRMLQVSKLGTGIWTLSGDNTYTGTTTVSAGKLFIDGDQSAATGDVTVAANATLGGTGIIGGNTTIANNGRLEFDLGTPAASHDGLDLASGRSLAFSGASTLTITSSGGAIPGAYTLVSAPGGITGTAPATVILPEDWEATVAIVDNDLVLTVTSVGDGPGPVASFTITGVPSQTVLGAAINDITITALDDEGQVATSFASTVTFGGTAGATGTSGNFVGGVLENVIITPTNIGSGLTITVDDGDGNLGLVALTVVSTAYQQWVQDNELTSGNDDILASPAGDGVTNIQKFAFGMDPSVSFSGSVVFEENGAVTAGMPAVWLREAHQNGADYRAVFSRRKNHQQAGLRYQVQFSAGLDIWVTSEAMPVVVSDPESQSDIEAVSIPYPMFIQTDLGFQKPKFFRVGVSME